MGTIIALPVDSFIVSVRKNHDLSHLNNKIVDRKIEKIIYGEKKYLHLSSTKIKKLIKSGKSINHLVPDPVVKIIEEYEIYK